MLIKKKKKGQSTVEYLILVTAVVAVVIAFLLSTGSPFKRVLNSSYDQGTNSMVNMSQRLSNVFNIVQ